MKKTIAGDIRRIRNNILKPSGAGVVSADYGELHKAFDGIEAKEKELKSLIKELTNALSTHSVCSGKCKICFTKDLCRFYKERALIAKAREVING